MAKGWQEQFVATDASQEYGFGVSVASAHLDVMKGLARAATTSDTLVRLDRAAECPEDEPPKLRKGTEFKLPISKAAFRTVISAKKAHEAHSGSLEATGVGLGLR